MPLEKQVSSLEPSQRLKELGVKQESYFVWFEGVKYSNEGGVMKTEDVWLLEHRKISPNAVSYSAFTVAELGEMLPETYGTYKGLGGGYVVCEIYAGELKNVWAVGGNTEADARAKMLIYLLENKLITL